MPDAYAEVMAFMISEVQGHALEAGKDFKDRRLASALAAEYPELGPDRQKQLSQIPLYRAAIRMLFNRNQDYIHNHVLSHGWTYRKYSLP